MRKTLEQLQELQQIVQQIEQLERDRAMLDVDVRNAERALGEKRRRLQQTHEERLEAMKKADSLQLQIEEAEQENEKLRVQLNTIHNEKEYRALRHTISSHEADIERWEDQALDLLGEVDELSAREQELEREVQNAEADLEKVRERVAERKEELADQIAMLRHNEETLRRQINDDVLSTYDRLARSKRSDPLAEVRNRTCLGCHTRITKQTENMLMRDNEIVFCHSCGRMLMLAE